MRPAHIVPCTLMDAHGRIIGYRRSDGELVPVATSPSGTPCVSWNEVTGKKEVVGVVEWDGAKPSPTDNSKGELLGDHALLRHIWLRLGITGPTFKTAHWGPKGNEEEVAP